MFCGVGINVETRVDSIAKGGHCLVENVIHRRAVDLVLGEFMEDATPIFGPEFVVP